MTHKELDKGLGRISHRERAQGIADWRLAQGAHEGTAVAPPPRGPVAEPVLAVDAPDGALNLIPEPLALELAEYSHLIYPKHLVRAAYAEATLYDQPMQVFVPQAWVNNMWTYIHIEYSDMVKLREAMKSRPLHEWCYTICTGQLL